MEQQEKPLITLQDISVNGLAAVNLNVHAGECVCLSGPSGSGKSLLLRTLADLIPHQGEVYFKGVACSATPPTQWRKQVGLLPAESFWWHELVGDHFTQKDDEKLQRLGFDKTVYDWSVRRCSTGERQRLALLRLLDLKPKVLLLDEPTASLDEENVEAVEALVKDFQSAGGAIIWVSHDTAQIKRIADRHYMIKGNQLQEVAV
jgi:ABC-type iron transport system FetAB ATPase subunit